MKLLIKNKYQLLLKRLLSVVLTLFLSFGIIGITPSYADDGIDSGEKQQQLQDIATQAYLYAYPLILMELTRQDAIDPIENRPMNQFHHAQSFPDEVCNAVIRPNVDTLYSTAWIDVSDEPVVFHVPEMPDRYYLMPILDMWTDVVASPGNRTTGTAEADFAMVGPNWDGTLPSNLEPIYLTTDVAWIGGRIQTNGSEDYDYIHTLQEQYTLTPLQQWLDGEQPDVVHPQPCQPVDITPPVKVAGMKTDEYFELFSDLLQQYQPHKIDWGIIQQLKQIDIEIGKDFVFSDLDPSIQEILEQGAIQAQALMEDRNFGESLNGWDIARDFMGTYATSYLHRAYVAKQGIGANLPEDAIYPSAGINEPFNGAKHNYMMHFDAGKLPPVNGFWSLTLYDKDGYLVNKDGYLVNNEQAPSSIDDQDNLMCNLDGSLDLYIQPNKSVDINESNWLRAPEDEFGLLLRLYWPQSEILTGDWNPPAVKVSRSLSLARFFRHRRDANLKPCYNN
ncbi:MAG: DUF1254 domain-containing protein [Symploca sp. SIO1A3]|nr:DUF1254 domain-containing protein [Symploca sp. SIO2C1]NER51922.1 DUF1254 domain-containing protein [Symploca sp. SIO1A3]